LLYFIAKKLAILVIATYGGEKSWWTDEDHTGALEMEINGARMVISCHILYTRVMFILYVSYFALIATVAL
jgi:hypothetical protein